MIAPTNGFHCQLFIFNSKKGGTFLKNRIWELDAFRGLCILGVVAVHFIYDLVELYGILSWEYPPVFQFIKSWGGVLFLLLSGTCATLGARSVRRGLIVFTCGLVISAVTAGMYWLGMADKGIIIWFGVLHCLGVCMLLWPVFRDAPLWLLALLGCAMVAVGLAFRGTVVDTSLLVPLGLVPAEFASSDYFPLLPNLGFFLLGAVLGKTAYRRKQSLLPRVDGNRQPFRFLALCGRYSLHIYLLHQPVLSGVCLLLTLL
jgi:uncharacterized membrane protein